MARDLEIWWIRHGQSLWNVASRWQGHSDIALSPQGEAQALHLRRALSNTHFDAVYSSDLQRALDTCRLALPERPPQADARLREVHFGEYEGLTWEEMTEPQQEALQRWLADPFAQPIPGPGGESLVQVSERLQEWFAELPSRGRVAVFTHGGVIRCNLWTSGGDGNPWKVQIGNGSTTAIRYTERAEVLWINDLSFVDE